MAMRGPLPGQAVAAPAPHGADAILAAAAQRFRQDAGAPATKLKMAGKKLLAVAGFAYAKAGVPLEEQLPLALALTGEGGHGGGGDTRWASSAGPRAEEGCWLLRGKKPQLPPHLHA